MTAFDPSVADLVIDAYERCDVRPAALTVDHLVSARRSLNFVYSRLANNGVNLWQVDQQTIPLIGGVATYILPADTINVLDVYLRTYNLGPAVDVAPAFSTQIGSSTVTATQTAHGLSVGDWFQIVVPVAVDGLLLQGYYQVLSVLDSNTFTFTAASPAASTDSGGAVPFFSAVAQDTTILVTLPNHGLLAGQTFAVQVQTTVGGVQLLGDYTVSTVLNPGAFTIEVSYPASSNGTAFENGGNTQIAGQQASPGGFMDRALGPISRTDYAYQPNKQSRGVPSTFWVDRVLPPRMTLWLTPDSNGPYEIRYHRMKRLNTGNPQAGETADIPYRYLEVTTALLAAHLAMKWAPGKAEPLSMYADQVWREAQEEDRERVPVSIRPILSGYFQ